MLVNRFTPKNHLKGFSDAPRAIKRQLPCPIELTFSNSLVGRNGILVIPRNHLDRGRHQDQVKVSATRRFPLYKDSNFVPQSWF